MGFTDGSYNGSYHGIRNRDNTGCDVGAESPVPLPSTAAEYVLLLPRLLGELLPRDVLARLEGHFPPSSAVWGP